MANSHELEGVHAVVIGAGVAGLGTALALSRQGHRVTIIERDATPMPTDADAAFAWDRRGAPQVRHSHALLALLRNTLRDRYPDVLEALLDAGATEMRFAEMLPEGIDDPSPAPGDDDLVALACRRTTFEWVLRRVVLDDPRVTLLDGSAAVGLAFHESSAQPLVTGVLVSQVEPGGSPRTSASSPSSHELAADLVIAANGRRSAAVGWLTDAGIGVEVQEEDTGIVYLSRFYRLHDGAVPPVQEGPIGGDLGYLKYAVFQGDNRTFSITFAVRTKDDELRAKLLDPAGFDEAGRVLPATSAWADPELASAITGVHVMAGLLNRHIRFTDRDGDPLVLGFHAVGDAHTCTNPLYGRGCSLGIAQANLLADALAHEGLDHEARARAYETASAARIEPWYHASVQQDRMARDAARREQAAATAPTPSEGTVVPSDSSDCSPTENTSAGQPGSLPTHHDPQAFLRDLLIDGVFPALRLHAVVFRAFVRMFNLLDPPDALFGNPELLSIVMATYQSRDEREREQPLGPPRHEMLAALAA